MEGGGLPGSVRSPAPVQRTRPSFSEGNLLGATACISYAKGEGFPEAGLGCAGLGWAGLSAPLRSALCQPLASSGQGRDQCVLEKQVPSRHRQGTEAILKQRISED